MSGAPGESYLVVAASYPTPSACGFGTTGERRVMAEGTLPGSGEVLVELDEPDAVSTLWRVFFTGRSGRVAGNYELTVRRDY